MSQPPPDDEPTLVPVPTAQDRSLRALTSLSDALSVEGEEDGLLGAALQGVVEDLGLLGGSVYLLQEDGGLAVRARRGLPVREGGDPEELARMVHQWERPLVREFARGGWTAAAPLQSRDRRLGVLTMHGAREAPAPEREVLRALGKQLGAGLENARLYRELRAAGARAEALARTNQALSASLDLATGVAALAVELRPLASFTRLLCAFVNDAGDYLEVVSEPPDLGWGLGTVVPVVGSGPGLAVLNDRPVLERDLLGGRRFIEDMRLLEEGVRSYLLLPLRTRGRCAGVLGLAAAEPDGYDDAALARLQPLVDAVAVALDNIRLFEKTKQLTITDELTPLYNSRFFHQLLERELKFVDRYQSTLSIVFLDLDRFKPVNDEHGHLRGSRVLREVGFLVRSAVRDTDYPARYGGDEFVVVLPQTDEQGARLMVERLQRTIEGHVFLQEEGINVRLGASAGAATYPSEAASKEALIRLADERMYRDKDARRGGRA